MGTSVVIADDLSRTDLARMDPLEVDFVRKNRHRSPRAAERSRLLAGLAQQALIAEAELTPKPGLVDRRGSGVHSDLSLAILRHSAFAIEPYFCAMASIPSGTAPSQPLREWLALVGREAEHAMFKATGGSNSHKGAIWTLGLLLSAAAMGDRDELDGRTIATS